MSVKNENNNKKYSVYLRHFSSGHRYVGVTSMENVEDRFKGEYNKFFKTCESKYGKAESTVLYTNRDKNEAMALERNLIQLLESHIDYEFGLNITLGGQSGRKSKYELRVKRDNKSNRSNRDNFYREQLMNFYVREILYEFNDEVIDFIFFEAMNKYVKYLSKGGKVANKYRYMISYINEALEENNIDLERTRINVFMNDEDFNCGRDATKKREKERKKQEMIRKMLNTRRRRKNKKAKLNM